MNSKLFATIDRTFLAPSASIQHVVDRRQARLAISFLLAQSLLLFVGASSARFLDGSPESSSVAVVLSGAALIVFLVYLLARTRQLALAIWVGSVFMLCIPLLVVTVTRNERDAHPFQSIVYLLVTVLFASVLLSQRGTIVTCMIGMICSAAMGWLGPAAWHAEVVHGMQFLLTLSVLILLLRAHRDRIQTYRAAEMQGRNAELEGLRETLEMRIRDRTIELTNRNEALRLVLDTLSQGLFIVDPTGVLAVEHSAVLADWFGPPRFGEKFYDYLARAHPTFGAMTAMAWSQLEEAILPREVALEQLPKAFSLAGKDFTVAYKPIGKEGLDGYLVVISDVTAENDREELAVERREAVSLFEQLLADPSGFRAFVGETSSMIAAVVRAGAEPSVELRRTLHTLKGNTSVCGLQSIAGACHDIEAAIERGEWPPRDYLARLDDRWSRVVDSVNRLTADGKEKVEIEIADYAALECAVHDDVPRDELARMVASFKLEPVQKRLEYQAAQVVRIADRLRKLVRVDVLHDGLRLDAKTWAPFWAALVHAARNAVDHGIETPQERARAGKRPEGTIGLRMRAWGAGVLVEIEDDGRGIDWKRLRQRAIELGVSAEGVLDSTELVFADGVSTAPNVTDISGRGVGMGAFRTVVETMGGKLEMRSNAGRGTLLRVLFPNAQTPTVAQDTSSLKNRPSSVENHIEMSGPVP